MRDCVLDRSRGLARFRTSDDAGRLQFAQADTTAAGTLLAASCLYDSTSRLAIETCAAPSSVAAAWFYDGADRAVGHRSGAVTRGPTPLPTSSAQQAEAALVSAELLAAVGVGGATDVTFALNAADVRVSETRTHGATTDVIPSAASGALEPLARGGETLTHDPDGNRTSDGTHRYRYDVLGRLVEIRMLADDSLVESRRYDGFGRWTGGTRSGVDYTRVLAADRVIAETEGGVVTHELTWHPRLMNPLVSTQPTGRYLLVGDGRGRQLAAVGVDGQVAERYGYGEFGAPTVLAPDGATVRAHSTIGCAPRFGGMEWRTGLARYETPARLFDPVAGLWHQPDPAGAVDSSWLYGFARHNPAMFADPSGWGRTTVATGEGGARSAATRADENWDALGLLAFGGLGVVAGVAVVVGSPVVATAGAVVGFGSAALGIAGGLASMVVGAIGMASGRDSAAATDLVDTAADVIPLASNPAQLVVTAGGMAVTDVDTAMHTGELAGALNDAVDGTLALRGLAVIGLASAMRRAGGTTYTGNLFRHFPAQFEQTAWRNVDYNTNANDRFTGPGRTGIYASEDGATATLEVNAHRARKADRVQEGQARSLPNPGIPKLFDVTTPSLGLDVFLDQTALTRTALPGGLNYVWPQVVGDAVRRAGYDGMIVRSARRTDEPLYNIVHFEGFRR